MIFEIWIEAFIWCDVAGHGNYTLAKKLAEEEASSFKEACCRHFDGDPLFDEVSLTHEGQRLFDNEAAARAFEVSIFGDYYQRIKSSNGRSTSSSNS